MSQIEQIITEIEDYMDSCKFQPLSQTKLIVNKDEMEELLTELRLKMPDEIKKYQKIIANKEAILSDAKEKSEAMIAEATAHITELVSEHEIMQRAQEEADQYVIQAREEAKKILNDAQAEANGIKESAVAYTDELLVNVQKYLQASISDFEAKSGNALNALSAARENAIKAVTQTTEDAVDTLAGSRERVLDSLKSLMSTEISLNLSGEVRPFIIRGDNDANLTELILPVRMEN